MAGEVPEISFDCGEGEAVQLVRITDRRFEVTAAAEALFAQVDGHIAVCAIGGKLRTGKSFLLNKIIGLEGEGFQVSDGVHACTKGLWIWSKPVYNDRQNLNIFFMDTEGLDSPDRNLDIDTKLFALSAIASSYLIFNTVGSIDQTAINGLALVAELVSALAATEQSIGTVQSLAFYAPRLLWVLRDFSLEARDAVGRPLSAREYLEEALTQRAGGAREERVRAAIRDFFHSRDCLTLVRPVFDAAAARSLPSLPQNRLRPEFLAQVNLVKSKVWQNCSAKLIGGRPLDGSLFLALLRRATAAFNANAVPVIASMWAAVLEEELLVAEREALEIHARHCVAGEESFDAFQSRLLAADGAALARFGETAPTRKRLPKEYELVERRFLARLDTQESAAFDAFRRKCAAKTEETLTRLYANLIGQSEQICANLRTFGALVERCLYCPLLAAESVGTTAVIARATAQHSASLFAAVAAAVERETADARQGEVARLIREGEQLSAAERALSRREEELRPIERAIGDTRARIAEAEERAQQEKAESLREKEKLEMRLKAAKAEIAALGEKLSSNRMKIENANKKKWRFCG